MRTKLLLTAAAALAAGLVSSNAQTVYSQNVVGYVSVAAQASSHLTLLCNPLDNGTNTLASLVVAPTASHALVWNGAGFTTCIKTPTSWSPNPTILPGEGFFLQPNGTATVTNVLIGTVVAAPGGSVTNTLPGGGSLSLVGSMIPYSEALGGTNINLKIPTASHALVWNGSGYTTCIKTPTSFSPNPTIAPGEGFFVQPTGGNYNWVQSLPSN